jgi:hypothetical protein
MAHYSYPSPDRTSALVVEMGSDGSWVPCRLISLNARFHDRAVGPAGSCNSAGWSPDGRWMYFAATVGGQHHLWRQKAADGTPEQLTFGPTQESGIAVDRDGRSLVTSIGNFERTLWFHDVEGEHQLSSEGQILGSGVFSADGQFLYYVVRHALEEPRSELQRLTVSTGKSEAVLPGVPVLEFDVSLDGTQVVYTSPAPGGTQLWLESLDRSAPPRRIGVTGERSPLFVPNGEILFLFTEGTFNYLGRMNQDGSARAKAVPYPISEIQTASPARNWVMAIAPLLDKSTNSTVGAVAIPVHGGNPVRVCEVYCHMSWSTDGKFLFASVEEPSLSSPGRTLAIPVGPEESLPALPPPGIHPLSDASVVPGARSIKRADLIPGGNPDTYAYAQTGVHRNLFRVMLPSPR